MQPAVAGVENRTFGLLISPRHHIQTLSDGLVWSEVLARDLALDPVVGCVSLVARYLAVVLVCGGGFILYWR